MSKIIQNMTKEEIIDYFEGPTKDLYDGMTDENKAKLKEIIHSDKFIKAVKYRLGWIEVEEKK